MAETPTQVQVRLIADPEVFATATRCLLASRFAIEEARIGLPVAITPIEAKDPHTVRIEMDLDGAEPPEEWSAFVESIIRGSAHLSGHAIVIRHGTGERALSEEGDLMAETPTQVQVRLILEQECRRLADVVKRELPPGQQGFGLFLFDFGAGGNIAYVSNADRQDMIRAMREWIERQEAAQ